MPTTKCNIYHNILTTRGFDSFFYVVKENGKRFIIITTKYDIIGNSINYDKKNKLNLYNLFKNVPSIKNIDCTKNVITIEVSSMFIVSHFLFDIINNILIYDKNVIQLTLDETVLNFNICNLCYYDVISREFFISYSNTILSNDINLKISQFIQHVLKSRHVGNANTLLTSKLLDDEFNYIQCQGNLLSVKLEPYYDFVAYIKYLDSFFNKSNSLSKNLPSSNLNSLKKNNSNYKLSLKKLELSPKMGTIIQTNLQKFELIKNITFHYQNGILLYIFFELLNEQDDLKKISNLMMDIIYKSIDDWAMDFVINLFEGNNDSELF